jgi:hypothetical protein
VSTVAECHRLVDLPLALFVSSLSVGHVSALALAFYFLCFQLLYGVVALFIKRAKAYFD